MAEAYVRDGCASLPLVPLVPQRAVRRLPHHVVEIDIPLGYVPLGVWLLDDNHEEVRHVDEKGRGCHMDSTTTIDSAPPIISRMCCESRMVAFESGPLLRNEHMNLGGGPDMSPHVDQQWFEPARDTIHLQYTTYLQPDRLVQVQGNPMCILHERATGQGVPASLTHDFTGTQGGTEWFKSMALLEHLGEISVCLKVVCIHIDERPAVQSRLFGTLGEERVVLADALDHELISKSRTLWKAHRLCHDPLTEAFFDEYENEDSVMSRYKD